MVFLDTCVWVELTGVRMPIRKQELFQAREASNLLKYLLNNGKEIVTFREQLIEVVSAIIKARFTQYNREAKKNNVLGCGDLKKFRKDQPEAYKEGIELCRVALHDICAKTKILQDGSYSCNIDEIVKWANLADVNDCIYYGVCMEKGYELYTFDDDYLNFNNDQGLIHWLHDVTYDSENVH